MSHNVQDIRCFYVCARGKRSFPANIKMWVEGGVGVKRPSRLKPWSRLEAGGTYIVCYTIVSTPFANQVFYIIILIIFIIYSFSYNYHAFYIIYLILN